MRIPIQKLVPDAVFEVPGTPDWLAIDEHVWVSSSPKDIVGHLDPKTNKVVELISVGKEPCSGLAAGFGSLWVPNCGDSTLSRVDLATGKVLATVPMTIAASEGGIAVGAREMAHEADDLDGRRRQLREPPSPHPRVELQVHRDGARVHSRHVFDQRHVGAPGLVHGGAVATVLDDLCGHVLTLIGVLAVTRHLAVNYHAPTRLNAPYELSAWLVRRDGRKLFLRAEGHAPHGQLTFAGDGVFLHVDPEHFARATSADQPPQ